MDKFAAGTKACMQAAIDATAAGATVIIGGGDTATAAERFGAQGRVSHISTGGGASLELLEGPLRPSCEHASPHPARLRPLMRGTRPGKELPGVTYLSPRTS